MVDEISSFLQITKSRLIVDATCGEGGHTSHFLKLNPNLNIIAIERDPEILKIARERLDDFSDRTTFINDNFSNIKKILTELEISSIDGILFDLGISSYHFKGSNRGFSFLDDELDMRLDESCEHSGREVVNSLSQKELTDIIRNYGDEKWAKIIARDIVCARKDEEITSARELRRIISSAIPKKYHPENIDVATKTFQAIRIFVNNEFEHIEKGISDAIDFVKTGGRIAAMSFHSLEDRIVKNLFRKKTGICLCPPHNAVCMCNNPAKVKILTSKPVIPINKEIDNNISSRSTKLRVAERVLA